MGICYTDGMIKQLIFLVLSLFVASGAWAKSSVLQKALDKYSKATSVQTEIKKTDEKMILGTKSETAGVLKYQKNKIYISANGEKKVEFFYSDKTLTLVEYPDAEFEKNGHRKVTTLKKSIPPLVTSLLNLFSSPKNFGKEFKTLSEKKEGDEYLITLQPAQKNLKNFSLAVDAKNYQIRQLSFTDEVDTKTTIQFMNVKLNTKINKADFQFTKLKTDEEMFE